MENGLRWTGFLQLVFLAVLLSGCNVIFADNSTNSPITQLTYMAQDPQTTVEFDGVCTFSGDIIFQTTTNNNLVLNIGKNSIASAGTNYKSPVVFQPGLGFDGPTYAHLIFEPVENTTIQVNLYSDLNLTGSNLDETMLSAGTNPLDITNTELTVTFRGKGTTVFNFCNSNNSCKLVATSLVGTASGGLAEADGLASTTDREPLGVAMYIAMDQSKQDVVVNGLNKVVFQRNSPMPSGAGDVEFQIGLNSFLTFISVNYTGEDSSNDPSVYIPADLSGSGTGYESYAAIAFDVSNFDTGSMYFTIKGSKMSNTYTDGAFTLAGCYLQASSNINATDPDVLRHDFGDYNNNDDIRNFVNFGQRAGSVAYLRVIDNSAYFYDKNSSTSIGYINSLEQSAGSEVGFISVASEALVPISTRRGLHIQCSNKSFAPLATNPYGDSAWNTGEWTTGENGKGIHPIQPGFTVGINGHIEINHNTFLDYTAQSANDSFNPSAVNMNTLAGLISIHGVTPESLFKQHNPSAMLIDGLGSAISNGTDQILFTAHLDQNLYRSAEITMYGNSSVTLRAPLLPTAGYYDGFRLSAAGETLGDGVFVTDIEGPLIIRSIADISGASLDYRYGLHAGSDYPASGALRLGSLLRSIDDREIIQSSASSSSQPVYVQRPLTISTSTSSSPVSYMRYDRPTVLINDKVDLIDIMYHHEDVSRYILPNVNQSPPAFCGGERALFLHTIFGIEVPDIAFLQIYNTQIHCHESICMSGVRLVVRELPDLLSLTGTTTSNISSIILYNHGYALDTNLKGFGRIFLLGSMLNTTASGASASFLEDSFFNIFRDSGQPVFLSTNTLADSINGLQSKLMLKTAPEVPINTSVDERAIQLFYLGNNSNVEIGWVSEVGLYRGDDNVTIYPWDHRASSSVTSSVNKFNLQTNWDNPATLSFAGDFIYLGGSGPNGETSPQFVSGLDLGRVIYVGHGALIEITEDLTNPLAPRPYIGFSDATIAILLWQTSIPSLSAQINLPYDQMILKNPIRPYGIDMTVLTDSVNNPYLRLTTLTGRGLGTTVSVAWQAISKIPGIAASLGLNNFNFRSASFRDFPESQAINQYFFSSRTINREVNPVTLPAYGLLEMSTGDYLDQLAVSGATPADPFLMYLTGDQNGISQIREVVTEYSTEMVPGEGAFAKFFIDQGARLGLGSRSWNAKSVNSWNLIGRNFVSIIPNGDAQIDVNSDLVVADAQPLIPTTNFGSTTATSKPQHRITFFSHDTREIRIPAGHELDLSAFGQANTDQTATQQIAFGGMMRLIFEPGSTLRFPTLTGLNVSKQPILYLDENSEMIFEAIQDMTNKFIGNSSDCIRWQSLQDSDRAKTRILGVGQIWINKTAKMSINDNAIVSIEVDAITPVTNLTISIQREGKLEIGNSDVLGGSLQIGNSMFNSDGTLTNISGASIDFTLRLNSPDASVYLGRNAFLGFGVGVVDRWEEVMNDHWRVQPLLYVHNIDFKVIQGVFSHNQIYDGTDSEASLIAIGPMTSPGGSFKIEVGATNAIILGGGNLLYIGDLTPTTTTSSTTVNILSTATALTGNDSVDNGIYNIMNPSVILSNISSLTGTDKGTTLKFVNYEVTNTPTDSVNVSESLLDGGFGFSGSSRDAYRYLSFRDLSIQQGQKYLALGKDTLESRIGYVMNGNIIRSTNLSLDSGITTADTDRVTTGVLRAATLRSDGTPMKNTLP